MLPICGCALLTIGPPCPFGADRARAVQWLVTHLSGAVRGRAGQVLAGDTDCTIGSLIGDVNGGGLVDNRDVIAVRVRRGESVTAGNRHQDINCDGVIDNSDLTAIRFRRGNRI